jgi:flagellin-like protein
MKIGKFKLSKKAVSPVIATLLMIAIAVAASIIVYVWSMGLLGGLMQSGGGSQTAEQLIMEAYSPTTDKATLRNTGSKPINVTAVYLDGNPVTAGIGNCGGATPVAPGSNCQTSILNVPQDGVSHTIKVVSRDGAVFVFTVVGGQASMIAPTIYAVKKLVA